MTGFRVTNAAIVIVVLAAAGIAAWQLARVVTTAQEISDKAANIAQSGRGINVATDSVIQLERTNRTAKSILRSAEPLQPRLAGVVSEAKGINGVAGAIDTTAGDINSTAAAINGTAGRINSEAGAINGTARAINGNAKAINGTAGLINGTAGAILSTAGDINDVAGDINSTAGDIRSTAGGINSEAGGILDVARRIDRDVFLINFFLNGSIDVASLIKSDTARILDRAIASHDTAACIDDKLGGGDDGDCQGRPPDGDFGPSDGPRREGTAPLGRRGGPGPMGGR